MSPIKIALGLGVAAVTGIGGYTTYNKLNSNKETPKSKIAQTTNLQKSESVSDIPEGSESHSEEPRSDDADSVPSTCTQSPCEA